MNLFNVFTRFTMFTGIVIALGLGNITSGAGTAYAGVITCSSKHKIKLRPAIFIYYPHLFPTRTIQI